MASSTLAVSTDSNQMAVRVYGMKEVVEQQSCVASINNGDVPSCPYPGLLAFQEQDSPFYYGREEIQHKLLRAITSGSFVSLIGAAGYGKSSLLHAALIPAVRLAHPDWLVITCQPSKQPYLGLAQTLIGLLHEGKSTDYQTEVQTTAQQLVQGTLSLIQLSRAILKMRPKAQRLLLVLDHVESLYTTGMTNESRRCFLAELLATRRAINAQNRVPLSVVMALRAELMGQALSDSYMTELLQDSDIKLGPMSDADLLKAISLPADVVGSRLEPELVQYLVDSLHQRPDWLYLVQHALRTMWPRQQNGLLTRTALVELGGLENTLTASISRFYNRLDAWQKQKVGQLFDQLACSVTGERPHDDDAGRSPVDQHLLMEMHEIGLLSGVPGAYRLAREEVAQAWLKLGFSDTPKRPSPHHQSVASEHQQRAALSRHLTAQAELLSQHSNTVQQSAILAIEALRRYPSITANHVLRQALALLPRPMSHWVHPGGVLAIAFSPSGTLLASGGHDGLVHVWDAGTGMQVSSIPHESAVTHVAFSPDEQSLLTVGADGLARIWALLDNKLRTVIHHVQGIRQATYSPDGQSFATAGMDKMVRVWDVRTGREMTYLAHDAPVSDIAFSPDGQCIVSASDDHSVRVWRISDGQQITHTMHRDRVNSVAFSPDSRYIASASSDHTVALWRATNNQQVALITHRGAVNKVAFSRKGKYLATASDDHTAQVWRVADHREVLTVSHAVGVERLAFSEDEQLIVTAARDGTARVWDLMNGKEVACISHDLPITDVAFSPDNRSVATASLDGTARTWLLMGKESVLLRHRDVVASVAFSPDGQLLATASWDHTACIWDAVSYQELARVQHDGNLNVVTFSPDGKLLATASGSYFSTSRDDSARLWDVATKHEVMRMPHDGPVRAVAFHPSGRWVATGSEDHTVRVWEVSGGIETRRVLCDGPVIALSYSIDGHLLACASGVNINLWDDQMNRVAGYLSLPDEVLAMVFSPKGKTMATADASPSVRIWPDPMSTSYIEITHDGPANALAFSADGKYLGVVGADRTVRMYDIASGQEMVRVEHDDILTSLAFSPDGRYLATGCYDSTSRLWLLETQDLISEACQRLTRWLTREEWQLYMGDEPYTTVSGAGMPDEDQHTLPIATQMPEARYRSDYA